KNGFDAASYATCRFWFRRPKGSSRLVWHPASVLFQDPHDKCGVDRLNRQRTNNWLDVGGNRCLPLRRMLCAAPARTVRLDVGFSALLECDRVRGLKFHLRARGTPCFDRINALVPELAGFHCLDPCFFQAKEGERSEPHLPSSSIQHVTINP